MRKHGSVWNCAALLVAMLLPVACATARGADTAGDAAPSTGVALSVRNNLSPPTSLRIYVLSEGGARDLIGSVNPAETTSLTVRQPPVGRYRFLARTDGGREIISNVVTFHEGEVLEWDLFSNIVTTKFDEREPGW